MTESRKALDLARMMIKQAKILRGAGFLADARELARRAVEINAVGHRTIALQPEPVRITVSRR